MFELPTRAEETRPKTRPGPRLHTPFASQRMSPPPIPELSRLYLLHDTAPVRLTLPREHCRGCTRAPASFIVLRPGSQRRAGLSDRAVILYYVSELAASLCAQVVAPGPCRMLDPQHNNEQQVSCQQQWSHYFELRNGRTGQAMLLQDSPRLEDSSQMTVINSSHRFAYAIGSDVIIAQYMQAVRAVDRSQPFIWFIPSIFYHWIHDLNKHLHTVGGPKHYQPAGAWYDGTSVRLTNTASGTTTSGSTSANVTGVSCQLVNASASVYVQRGVAHIERVVGLPLSTLSTLHIRAFSDFQWANESWVRECSHPANIVRIVRDAWICGSANATPSCIDTSVQHASTESGTPQTRIVVFSDEPQANNAPSHSKMAHTISALDKAFGSGSAVNGERLASEAAAAAAAAASNGGGGGGEHAGKLQSVKAHRQRANNYDVYAITRAVISGAARRLRLGYRGDLACRSSRLSPGNYSQ